MMNQAERPPVATEDGVAIRPALELLSRLRGGALMDMLAVEINRVVRGVRACESGKGGIVTLTLKIEPVKKVMNGVYIQAIVSGKAPEDPPQTDLMFHDEDGNLHTRNPEQRDMFEEGLRAV